MNLFFYICLLITCLCSCQKTPRPIDQKKQYLRLNINTEPPTLDARKATDTSSIAIIKMCFEGLMKKSRDGGLTPGIAYRVEISEDNLVYIFHLRSAKWWDGKPVTAYDFEKTWKTTLHPTFVSGAATELYVLKNGFAAKSGLVSVEDVGVKALDASTLRVELDHHVPYFMELSASHSFYAVPSHITTRFPQWADNGGPLFIGNGPYRLVQWRHHNQILLRKNKNYWDEGAVTLDQIHLSIVEDENTELNMYESGELDWAGYPLSQLPTDALQALSDQNRLHTYPISGTYYYVFNVNTFPFDNINLRKAFTLAINRKEIIDNITQSNQLPAVSLIPPTIWKVHQYFADNSVEEAKELFERALKEMNLTRATFPEVTLIYNTSASHHKIAQAIQEQWFQAFGIRVKLANKEWKVFLNELSHKQFQIARMGGIANFKDPITFFDLYRYEKSVTNFSGWANLKFSSLIETAEQTVNPIKRESYLREAEHIFMSEMPIAPIYYYTGTYLKKGYVKGVELTELSDVNFKFAFLEMQ